MTWTRVPEVEVVTEVAVVLPQDLPAAEVAVVEEMEIFGLLFISFLG
jgi:hypothetical protein